MATSFFSLQVGEARDSALGVFQYLRVPKGKYQKGTTSGPSDYEIWLGMSEGMSAIIAEVKANGTAADNECLEYILFARAGN